MQSTNRVRRAAVARMLAASALLAGSAMWQPASAQYYRGFGFPFFGGPWSYDRPAPEPRMPRRRPPREHQPAEITTPPAAQKPDVAPAKTGVVIGDSMAEWLAYGLEQAYAESSEVGVVRKVRPSVGLIDQCKGELRKWLEQGLANEKPAFVAIMIGMSDRHSMQACAPKAEGARAGSQVSFRSKEWEEAYGKEVDEAIGVLKSKGVPVFWVGLPPAKNIRAADLDFLNDIFREHADKGGIGYIDVWETFVDEDGDFTMRGPDVNGQTRQLRTADGLNFTKAGARKLALNLEREVGRTVLHTAPAEAPVARGTPAPAAKPDERPVAGPVMPLTRTPPSGTGCPMRTPSGRSVDAVGQLLAEASSGPGIACFRRTLFDLPVRTPRRGR